MAEQELAPAFRRVPSDFTSRQHRTQGDAEPYSRASPLVMEVILPGPGRLRSRIFFDILPACSYNAEEERIRRDGDLHMSPFRRNMLLSGLGGLFVCGLVTAIAIWLLTSGAFAAPLPYPAVTLLFIMIFGAFSIAEIPMMVYAMRRLVIERKGNYGVVIGLNAVYVSFAGVYALPVFLFTGSVLGGLALSALGIVRLVASLLLVREH